MKKAIFILIVLSLLWGFAEGSAFVALSVLQKQRGTEFYPADTLSEKHRTILTKFLAQESNYLIHSVSLGWTIKQSGVSDSKLYQANSQGIRASREYQVLPSSNTLRIATFGDSFTHCDEVRNGETWQDALEKEYEGLEVLNFGVSGHALDQAFLRYQERGKSVHPHLVFIGFMSENIYRNLNVFRPFYRPYTYLPLAKPRFTLEHEMLALKENPLESFEKYHELTVRPAEILPVLGKYDHYYQALYTSGSFDFFPSVRFTKILLSKLRRDQLSKAVCDDFYNESSPAYRLLTKIFAEFSSSVLENDSLPIILLFPNKDDLKRYMKEKTSRYKPLVSYLESQGYLYIDLMEVFAHYTEERYQTHDPFYKAHYSPLGNRLVAEYILKVLQEKELLHPEMIQDRIRRLQKAQHGKNT